MCHEMKVAVIIYKYLILAGNFIDTYNDLTCYKLICLDI